MVNQHTVVIFIEVVASYGVVDGMKVWAVFAINVLANQWEFPRAASESTAASSRLGLAEGKRIETGTVHDKDDKRNEKVVYLVPGKWSKLPDLFPDDSNNIGPIHGQPKNRDADRWFNINDLEFGRASRFWPGNRGTRHETNDHAISQAHLKARRGIAWKPNRPCGTGGANAQRLFAPFLVHCKLYCPRAVHQYTHVNFLLSISTYRRRSGVRSRGKGTTSRHKGRTARTNVKTISISI
jgi:hypothetical protein